MRHDDRAGNQGLEKSFGGLKVTRDLSLQVEQGARHALIGPNGAGKTTVINLLTGVLKPNGGRILLEGNDITDLAVHTQPHPAWRGCGLGFLAAFGSRQQALSLALPHVLVVFRGPGARRRVRGQAADRRRNGVADSGCDFLVDRAATNQAAAREGNGEDRDNMARASRHRQKVTL